jgi:ABC-type polysaccharide/polyol phosphate export permease
VLLPGVGQEFANDRLFGTLTVALATDASKLRLWAEKAVYQLPNAIYSMVVAFVVGWIFFDIDVPWSAMPWAAASLVAALVGAVALALLAGSVSLVYRDWAVPATVFGGIIFLLGGVVISRRGLPIVLERASYFVPTANALEAFRRALREQSWTQVAPLLLAELAVAGLTLLIGYVVFTRFVERARREGLLTLDQTL